ncbi:MAG: UDP-N-acetylmuramoylalanyl-D-glutamyl-2,6-diaminopimelate--D-alanyl-D-alanine ligase [Pseudomonadota bacterium]
MADPIWTLGEAMDATDGRSEGDASAPIAGFSIDSRDVHAGEGFIAIRGPNRDGHGIVAKALDAGAACAIVEEAYGGAGAADDAASRTEGRLNEARLIRVTDTFDALNDLGRQARERIDHAAIIAVTGSAGKTGTKEALRAALAPSGTVHASAKSFNNHWGVPLTLANTPRDIDYGVYELGMNHAGEISELTALVRPHIAIVTTIAPVHLGFFASVEEIADAKAEIFEGLEPGGAAILNRDNAYFERLAAAARRYGASIYSFGEDERAKARLVECDLTPDGSTVTADILGETITYSIGAPGRHVVQNTLAVLAAAKLAGANLKSAAGALATIEPPEGRGARIVIQTKDGPICLVDESYNANPASMRAALATLGLTPREDYKRRIAVLGDMLELGDEGPGLHRDLAQAIKDADIDTVFACGELMSNLFEALPQSCQGAYATTSEDLAPVLLSSVAPGDIVMVKGSLGSRMGPLIEALKREFDSR